MVKNNDRDFVGALQKGLLVIESFDENHAKQTLSDVARRTGMTRAATRRYLLTLVQLGYAESDGKLFWLVPRVLSLGYAFLSSTPLPRLAQPILDRIGEKTDEIASIAVRDGEDVIFLAHSTSRRLILARAAIGMRIPLYCSAAGKIILANQSDEEKRRFLKGRSFRQLTTKTKTTATEIMAELVKACSDGFAISDEELELGLRSIAVPVPDSQGRVNLAITVSLHAARMTVAQMIKKLLPELQVGRQSLASML
jgi:IclR family pca regulon transcriptional regulator